MAYTLFLANLTKQHHEVHFRVPDTNQPRFVSIPAGGQREVYKAETMEPLTKIIETTLMHYGAVEVPDIDQTAGYIGLVYQINKPATVEEFFHAEGQNDAAMDAQAQEMRRVGAVVADKLIERADPTLGGVEVTVAEETRGFGGKVTGLKEEKIGVDRPGSEGRVSRRQDGSRQRGG